MLKITYYFLQNYLKIDSIIKKIDIILKYMENVTKVWYNFRTIPNPKIIVYIKK